MRQLPFRKETNIIHYTTKAALNKSRVAFCILGLLVMTLGLSSCHKEKKSRKIYQYDGPVMEQDSIRLLFSDSAIVRVQLQSPKQFIYDNGDREFPVGVFIIFYDKDGTKSSTLRANSGYFYQKKNLYKAMGDVEVNGLQKKEKMNTEELFWDPDKKQIYTNKFVRIETDDQISTGEGLVADQDFTSYRINKPSGTISIDQ